MIINFRKKRTVFSATCLLDQWKICSATFLLLIVASCLFLDKPLALFFESSHISLKAPFLLINRLLCPMLWAIVPQAVFFYVRFFLRKEKKSRKFWYLSLTLPLGILLCKVAELCFGRASPE